MNLNQGVLDGIRRIGGRFRDLTVDGGLPGVPLGLRIRGAVTSGAPTAGTWKAGDHTEDRIGNVWICIAGGTPGAWVQAGHKARNAFYVYEDFFGLVNSSYMINTAQNSGAITIIATDAASSCGLAQLSTGSSSASGGGAVCGTTAFNSIFFSAQGTWIYETRVKIPTLSTSGQTFQAFAGFVSGNFAESSNGAYFSYTYTENSGDWTAVTALGGTRTRTDTGVNVVAGSWYVLKVIVTPVNGSPVASFYVNDALTVTTPTNVPTASLVGYGDNIVKSNGTNALTFVADYFEVAGYFPGNR